MPVQAAPEVESPPIRDEEEIVALFQGACTPEPQWRVGLEFEKFGLLRDTLKAAPYGGPRGILRAFEILIERHGWTPVRDSGHIIALTRADASITLEPGGQFELSGSPKNTLHDLCEEMQGHLDEVREVGELLQIDWVGLGAHPTCTLDEIEWMPKPRYDIMRRYLPTRGRHAHDMMKRTCTTQASFDFESEADCAEKMRLAMGLSPIVSALFANSPIVAGAHHGYQSERLSYWLDTDPDRCGLFLEVFEGDWGFRRYVRRVLDTPMFFIKRGDVLIDYAGQSFRELLQRGLDGHRATLADFELHMSTLFPEARLKRVIEVRGADAGGPRSVCALPAIWKGILYDKAARKEAWDLVSPWTPEERLGLWREVPKTALETRIRGMSLLELAGELVRISKAGLARQAKGSTCAADETEFLEEIEATVFEERRSPAARILERWHGPWKEDVRKLVEHARY